MINFTNPTATPSVISSQQQSQNNSPGHYSLDLLSNSIPSTPIVLSGLQPDTHTPQPYLGLFRILFQLQL